MNYVPLIVVVLVLFAAMSFSRRNKARALAAQQQQLEAIRFGTEVMTTSGLYGTVVGVNDDETVQLSIAPGTEVKWALAAVRPVSSTVTPGPPPASSDESDEPSENSEPPSS